MPRPRTQRDRATSGDSTINGPNAWLHIVGSGQSISVAKPLFTIGSAGANDLVVADPYVSKRHCRLSWAGEALWISDERSANGTWVNGVRIDRCSIGRSANILIGRTTLQLDGLDGSKNPCGIVGEHPAMQQVFRQIRRLGPSEHNILVSGETGTGKELVARAIHEASDHYRGPFEAMNCAAIPHELAESELFGHVKGAFTGATQAHAGVFLRANGGTLFLDEIGDMPLELQPKLLRVLEDRRVRPVGGSESIPVHVRVIAASNRDLLGEAKLGRFRLDLYHRLAVGVVALPPLRERKSDIALLVQHFLEQIPGRVGQLTLASDVLPLLTQQPWPGNVRALRSALLRATMNGGSVLGRSDFDFLKPEEEGDRREGYVRFEGRTFEQIRHDIYSRVLQGQRGNRSAAAMALGISKSTFSDQLRAMGL